MSIPLGIFFWGWGGRGEEGWFGMDSMGQSGVEEETPCGTELEHNPAALLGESEELGVL